MIEIFPMHSIFTIAFALKDRQIERKEREAERERGEESEKKGFRFGIMYITNGQFEIYHSSTRILQINPQYATLFEKRHDLGKKNSKFFLTKRLTVKFDPLL